MKKEKLIKVLNFIGDLLDNQPQTKVSEEQTKDIEYVKEQTKDIEYVKEQTKDIEYVKEQTFNPFNNLMENAKGSFNRVVDKMDEINQPSILDYDIKTDALKQVKESSAIKKVIGQYINNTNDTNAIIKEILGDRKTDTKLSLGLRLFIKNTWDTITSLEKAKLIDKTKLKELTSDEGFINDPEYNTSSKLPGGLKSILKLMKTENGQVGYTLDMGVVDNQILKNGKKEELNPCEGCDYLSIDGGGKSSYPCRECKDYNLHTKKQ